MLLAQAAPSLVPNIEGTTQLGELGLALLLAALIGFEREVRQKSAGLRTHSLVGLGAALFMLVSKYGFSDVLLANKIVVDPSRVAAQIVSGIGFLGAGIIFVRSDAVRGLTTAASIWLTAAVGAAAGAGLPLLALVATAAYFLTTLVLTPISRRLPSSRWSPTELNIRYEDGKGLLRRIVREVTEAGFSVASMSTAEDGPDRGARTIDLSLQVFGKGSTQDLALRLDEIDGVMTVSTSSESNSGD